MRFQILLFLPSPASHCKTQACRWRLWILEIASVPVTVTVAASAHNLVLLLLVLRVEAITRSTCFCPLLAVTTLAVATLPHLTSRLHLTASAYLTHTAPFSPCSASPVHQLRPSCAGPQPPDTIIDAEDQRPLAASKTSTQAIPGGATPASPHSVSNQPGLPRSRHEQASQFSSGRLHIIPQGSPDGAAPAQVTTSEDQAQAARQPHPSPTALLSGSEQGTKRPDHAQPSKMIFTSLYKSPLSRLRHTHQPVALPPPPGSTDYSADLVSKDKSRQKDAVKRYLKDNVRTDWTFTWPPETSRPAPPASPSDVHDPAANEEEKDGIDVVSKDETATHELVEEDETALDTGEEADGDSDVESVYSTVSDDPLHWKPRLEWSSELSDDELPYNSPSPFKFDSPDSIGQAVTASKIARKSRRRKELRKETAWNDGLACFEARRAAWTGAKVARIRPKPSSPLSPISPRRGMFWRTHSRASQAQSPLPLSPSHLDEGPLSPASPAEGDAENGILNAAISQKTSSTDSSKQPELLLVETLIPIPPPLLPPANPMRASINPTLYNSIYEKVVVNSLQPSCPINLSDMIRACVCGWKRDGEWPPRSAVPEPAAVVAVRRKKNSISAIVSSSTPHSSAPGRKMSFSFLGHGRTHEHDSKPRRESAAGAEEGPGPGKAIRRSLQRVLGIGQTMVTAADGHIPDH